MAGEELYEEVRTYTSAIPGDGQPHILVQPVKKRTEVVITCGFGGAVVQVAMRERSEDAWINLPAISTWNFKLKIGEMLLVRSDANVRVPVALSEAFD